MLENHPECFEVTVEDPTEVFNRMRDLRDIKVIIRSLKDEVTFNPVTSDNLESVLKSIPLARIIECAKIDDSRAYKLWETITFALIENSVEK